MSDTEFRLARKVAPGIHNRRGGNVKSPVDVFGEIRIILRDACTQGVEERKPPVVEDPNDNYNKIMLKAEMKLMRLKQQRGGHINKPLTHEFSVRADAEFECPYYAYLLEDWYQAKTKEEETDKRDKEIKEEADEEEETDKEKEINEKADEEEKAQETAEDKDKQLENQKEKADEREGESSYGDFLNHFPAVRKFVENNQSMENMRRMQSSTDVAAASVRRMQSSMEVAVASARRIQTAAIKDISSVKVFAQRSLLPLRPSRALVQPGLVKVVHFVSRFARFAR